MITFGSLQPSHTLCGEPAYEPVSEEETNMKPFGAFREKLEKAALAARETATALSSSFDTTVREAV